MMDAKFFAGIACPLATEDQLSRSFPSPEDPNWQPREPWDRKGERTRAVDPITEEYPGYGR